MALVTLCCCTATAEEWSRLSPGAARWQAASGEEDGGVTSEVGSPKEAAGIVTVAAEREVELAGHESAGDGADDSTESDACEEADGACSEALGKLRADTLASIDLDIRVGGRPGNDYPCECRIKGETFSPRCFAPTTFTWKAAGYCHKPLYFEQWNLERYGHSYGFIPDVFLSGAHFFVTLPILPYKMGVELPWECVYPLGYYRPGNCAPWTCPAVPISGRGLALEAATITGAVFLLP
jgi:hypothetical protein